MCTTTGPNFNVLRYTYSNETAVSFGCLSFLFFYRISTGTTFTKMFEIYFLHCFIQWKFVLLVNAILISRMYNIERVQICRKTVIE